jgi:hypothetical protein
MQGEREKEMEIWRWSVLRLKPVYKERKREVTVG